jgi:membrane-associated phospholipid phosphatase
VTVASTTQRPQSRVAARATRAALCIALALASRLSPLASQEPDTLPPDVRSFPVWQAGAVLGLGLFTIAVLDEPINTWVQDSANRSTGLDDLSNLTRKFGEGVVIAPVTLGLIAVGVVANEPPILHAGLRVGAAVLLTTAVTQAAKYALGRERPGDTDDEWDFDPFGGAHAMWSGHTSSAFAFATVLSQEINHPWATVGLYALATGTAWSRVYDNAHWASDVIVGAAAGIACAKIATGRWTIFGLRAPVPLVANGRVGLMWGGSF